MEKINFEHSDEEIKKVETYLGFVKSQLSSMGNNNYEYALADQIFLDYMDGKLPADEAIAKLQSVVATKQVVVF